MKKLADLQLIIFDLDGTLVDSGADICDATNVVLAHLGKPLLTYEEIPDYLGSGLTVLLQKALQTKDETLLAEARRVFDLAYQESYTHHTRPYPGVVDTLRQLSKYQKAVFSNKNHAFTVGMIGHLGLAPFFDYVLGARPEEFALKPSPAGIHLIMQALHVRPENTLIIGDSTHDIEAGKAAGILTGAVTYGYRPRSVLEVLEPDFLMDRFEELLNKTAVH